MSKSIVIIGGVAGGMATATRLRRLREDYKITVIEKGKHVSYANCGLPYYIGDIIKEKERLIVKTPQEISSFFNIDIKTKTEALEINKEEKKVRVKDLKSNREYDIDYDELVLSTGAKPIVPSIEGIMNEKVMTLRSVEDMEKIKEHANKEQVKDAVVIGGGFIGLEMAENLRHIDLNVSLIELGPQVMPPVDYEMAQLIHQDLMLNGVKLYLENTVERFEDFGSSLQLTLKDGQKLRAELVILAIGVVPDALLAQNAGLKTGLKGSIVVDDKMQTSHPNIYAVGDAVQVINTVGQFETLIPLAGPANRQARVLAENLAGFEKTYKGTQGTSIAKVFDMAIASTGLNEKNLKNNSIPYKKVFINNFSHAGYYPDSFPIMVKLLFTPDEGKILGAQIAGCDGVDKRIDVIATSIHYGRTVYDLEELELAYAPPYNSVKDPVNIAGNVAVNILKGLVDYIDVEELEKLPASKVTILDVASEMEHKNFSIPDSFNIPIEQLRNRLDELDKSKTIVTYCPQGVRSYNATRILMQNGFKSCSLNGGLKLYKTRKNLLQDTTGAELPQKACCSSVLPVKQTVAVDVTINAEGLQCPGPIMQLKNVMATMEPGQVAEISVTDMGFMTDVKAWCENTGNILVSVDKNCKKITALVKKAEQAPANQSQQQQATTMPLKKDKTLIVFSNDLDKVLASFIIANGAAAMGDKVTLFFTFWGLNALRKSEYIKTQKSFLDRMFAMMMPQGPAKLTLSKMNMMGMGTEMMKYVMKKKNVFSLPELIDQARKNNVRLVACTMSMDVMGLKKEELIDGVEETGVVGYLDAANQSAVNLFI